MNTKPNSRQYRPSSTSLSNVPSLKPELEFEIIKLVLLRETYLKRLNSKLLESTSVLNTTTASLFDLIREISLDVVETIYNWQRAQVAYPNNVRPFLWNGEDYLRKVCTDLSHLDSHPQVQLWLQFELKFNPFIVPPEILSGDFNLASTSFVVFGHRPVASDTLLNDATEPPRVKGVVLKSPYLTPVINTFKVSPTVLIAQRIAAERAKAEKESNITARISVVAQKNNDKGKESEINYDVFNTYLSYDFVQRVRRCSQYLYRVNRDLQARIEDYTTTFGFWNDTMSATAASGTDHPLGIEMLNSESLEAYVRNKSKESLWEENVIYSSRVGTANKRTNSSEKLPTDMTIECLAKTRLLSPQTDNKYMRMSTPLDSRLGTRQSKSRLGTASSFPLDDHIDATLDTESKMRPTTSSVWTPHEVELKRAIQKRGGELFIITTASTIGRVVPPLRRSRFERLESDLNHMCELHEQHAMAAEEAALKWQPIASRILRDEERSSSFFINDNDRSIVLDSQEGYIDPPVHADLRRRLQRWWHIREHSGESHASTEEGKLELAKEMKIKLGKQRELMQYQYDHFRKVMAGKASDLSREKHMRRLQDGHALEKDEKLAMSFEDIMATRLQRFIRRVYGKVLKVAIDRRRYIAATEIQGIWRRALMRMLVHRRTCETNLAKLLQRLWRGSEGKQDAHMRYTQLYRLACARNIQRVYRGYKGRLIALLKVEFLKTIDDATTCVSDLAPSDFDELADAIDEYLKSPLASLPIVIMTVIRAVLFMFRGDESDIVGKDIRGNRGSRIVRARSATWNQVRLYLRRKGKFLRRLRSFISIIRLPNPRPFVFTEDCVLHLQKMKTECFETDLSGVEKGRRCVGLLFQFVRLVTRIYEIQNNFTEYYEASLPIWFRSLVKLRKAYETVDLQIKVEVACREELMQRRKKVQGMGKRFILEANALVKAEKKMMKLLEERLVAKEKLDSFFKKLETQAARRIELTKELVRAKELDVAVAKNDVLRHLQMFEQSEAEMLVELYRTVDRKTLVLLELRARLVYYSEEYERDQDARMFDRHINYDLMNLKCIEAGAVKAELLYLSEVWREFLSKIGGPQYIQDLEGEERDFYVEKRAELFFLSKSYEVAMSMVKATLDNGLSNCEQYVRGARKEFLDRPWDDVPKVVADAEEEENFECSRRDIETMLRDVMHRDSINVSAAPWQQFLVLLDKRISKALMREITDELKKFKFEALLLDDFDFDIVEALEKLQREQRHVILLVDHGTHRAARGKFHSVFEAIINALDHKPRVVSVDAVGAFRLDDWCSERAMDQKFFPMHNVDNPESSLQCDFCIVKMRRIAGMMKCMGHSKESGEDLSSSTSTTFPSLALYPSWMVENFQRDLKQFFFDIDSTAEIVDSVNKHPFRLLAAAVCSSVGLLKAPKHRWTEAHIREASWRLSAATNGHIDKLSEILELPELPPVSEAQKMMVSNLRNHPMLPHLWRRLVTLDLHESPLQYLLVLWLREMIRFMDCMNSSGCKVGPEYNQGFSPVEETITLTQEADMSAVNTRYLVGRVMSALLKNSCLLDRADIKVRVRTFSDSLSQNEGMGTMTSISDKEQHVFVYHFGEDVFFGVDIQSGPDSSHIKRVERYFTMQPLSHVLNMFGPNKMEIFEGSLPKLPLEGDGARSWFEYASEWLNGDCLRSVDAPTQERGVFTWDEIYLMRARSIMFSKQGILNGYAVRIEAVEEGFGKIRIYVFVLSFEDTWARSLHSSFVFGKNPIVFSPNEDDLEKLLRKGDVHEERYKIQMADTLGIANLLVDRLELLPPAKWLSFVRKGEGDLSSSSSSSRPSVSPVSLSLPPVLRIRHAGPGRFVGRRLVKLFGVKCLVTVYEQQNDIDVYGLRMCVYELRSRRTIEFRVSAMERLVLFPDDSQPLFSQMLKRLYLACRAVDDITATSHKAFLSLPLDSKPIIPRFLMDNFQEGKVSSRDQYQIMYRNVSSFSNDVFDKDRGVKTVGKTDCAKEDACEWTLQYDRSIVYKFIGNLKISVIPSFRNSGFFFINCFDGKWLRETSVKLSFAEACEMHLFSSKDSDSSLNVPHDSISLSIQLKRFGQSLYLKRLRSVLDAVQMDGNKDCGIFLSISSLNPVYARKVHVAFLSPYENVHEKKSLLYTISIISAIDMHKASTIKSRVATCTVIWNAKEVGAVRLNSSVISAIWSTEHPLSVTVEYEDEFEENRLEIFIRDTTVSTASPLFLGRAVASWEQLGEAFSTHKVLSLPLAKYSDGKEDDRFVKGFIQVSVELGIKEFSASTPDSMQVKETPPVKNNAQGGEVNSSCILDNGAREPDIAMSEELASLAPPLNGRESFEFNVLSLANVSSDYALLIKLNGVPYKEITLPGDLSPLVPDEIVEANENSSPIINEVPINSHFVISAPKRFALQACRLEFLLFNHLTNVPVSSIEIHGIELEFFFHTLEQDQAEGSNRIVRKQLRFYSRDHSNSTALLGPNSFVVSAPKLESSIKLAAFRRCARQQPLSIANQSFKLRFLTIRNLPKTIRDVTLSVSMNGEDVGTTAAVSVDNQTASWGGGEIFSLQFNHERLVECCYVDLIVRGYQIINNESMRSSVIGTIQIHGEELVTFLSDQENRNARSLVLALAEDTASKRNRLFSKQQKGASAAPTLSLNVEDVNVNLNKTIVNYPTRQNRPLSRRTEDLLNHSRLLTKIANSRRYRLGLQLAFAGEEAWMFPLLKSLKLVVLVYMNNELVGKVNILNGSPTAPVISKGLKTGGLSLGDILYTPSRASCSIFNEGERESHTLNLYLPHGVSPYTSSITFCLVEVSPVDIVEEEALDAADNPPKRRAKIKNRKRQRSSNTGKTTPAQSKRIDVTASGITPDIGSLIGRVAIGGFELEQTIRCNRLGLAVSFPVLHTAKEVVPSIEVNILCEADSIPDSIEDKGKREICVKATKLRLIYQDGIRKTDPTQPIFFSFQWNGQDVWRSVTYFLPQSNGIVESQEESSVGETIDLDEWFNFLVPYGHFTHECTLEVLLWQDITFLGSAVVDGPVMDKAQKGSVWPLSLSHSISSLGRANETDDQDESVVLAEIEIVVDKVPSSSDALQLDYKKFYSTSGSDTAVVSSTLQFGDQRACVPLGDNEQLDDTLMPQTSSQMLPCSSVLLELSENMKPSPLSADADDEIEERVCWRGRAWPQALVASDQMKELLTNHRSARLIHMDSLVALKPVTKITYLRDAQIGVAADLPVTVFEVLSHGPGPVLRRYRIELCANNGMIIGSAMIENNLDLQDIVGDMREVLMPGEQATWKLPRIFEYIVRNHLKLEIQRNLDKVGEDLPRLRLSLSQILTADSSLTLLRPPREGRVPRVQPAFDIPDRPLRATSKHPTDVLRIYSKKHRIGGTSFTSFVFMVCDTGKLTDKFFQSVDGSLGLRSIALSIKCRDRATKKYAQFYFTGTDIQAWLPEHFPLNLSSKLKRSQFANYIICCITLTYHKTGGYSLRLYNLCENVA